MELNAVKLLQRVSEEAVADFRAARMEYIRERIDMGVRPTRIAEDLGISKQNLNFILREMRQQSTVCTTPFDSGPPNMP